jgi:hypothetical protein
VLVGAVLMGTAGTAVAVGSGATLPAPLRAVAVAVGLPVDSAQLAETKTVLRELKTEMASGQAPPARRADVARAARALRSHLGRLAPAERAKVEADIAAELSAADTLLAPPPPPVQAPAPVPPTTVVEAPPTTAAPHHTEPPPTVAPDGPPTTAEPPTTAPPPPPPPTTTTEPAPTTTVPGGG